MTSTPSKHLGYPGGYLAGDEIDKASCTTEFQETRMISLNSIEYGTSYIATSAKKEFSTSYSC